MTCPVTTIFTLGPSGTNCEAAAHHWFDLHGVSDGKVVLYRTLEEAAEDLPQRSDHALLGCAVYPDLHLLVFRNLLKFQMFDTFVHPTYNMVLAAREAIAPRRVVSHPAPSSLVPDGAEVSLTTSNAVAAQKVAAGEYDACITTSRSAADQGLVTLQNFGPVPMVFTLHRPMPGGSGPAAAGAARAEPGFA